MRSINIHSVILSILTLLFIGFQGCKKEKIDKITPENGTLSIGFNIDNLDQKSLKGSSDYDLSEVTSALVTITNSMDEIVYNRELVTLYNFNGEYISEPLSLLTDNYHLTEFLLVDAQGNVLFVCPIEGSTKAYLVNDPLPIEFSIIKDIVTKICPEILSAEIGSPEDFGYVTFTFNVVETFDFLLSVFIYNPTIQNFELTSADINIEGNGEELYDHQIDPVTASITIKDNYPDYTLTIAKNGYQNYSYTFGIDSLKTHCNSPLMVVLQENANNVLFLRPNSEDGKDAVFCSIVPNTNYGFIEDIHLYAWTQDGILNVLRVAIEFDLSSLPANAIIDSAVLKLYHNPTSVYMGNRDGNEGENSIFVRRIIEPWEEGTIVWNNQPNTDATNEVYIPNSDNPQQNYKIDVTQLVTDMINDLPNSHGFMLKHVYEDPYKITYLASSEHPNSDLHPSLTIYYKTAIK
ncbi:MAG: DNRLRE domain-containing protein [Bacteroidales bacterium]|nr:DNRLRE domain-containing protein [Bacteroidales bacterium]